MTDHDYKECKVKVCAACSDYKNGYKVGKENGPSVPFEFADCGLCRHYTKGYALGQLAAGG